MGNRVAQHSPLEAGVLRDEAPLSLLEVDDFPDSVEVLSTFCFEYVKGIRGYHVLTSGRTFLYWR